MTSLPANVGVASTGGTDVDPKTAAVIQRNSALQSELATWKTEWQNISDYIMPQKSQIDERQTPGVDGFTQNMYDSEGPFSAGVLSSGTMDATMGGIFFGNQSPDPEAPADAMAWWKKTGEIELDLMQASNIFRVAHSCIHQRGVFATAHMHIQEDIETVFFATSEDIGTFSIDVNHRGEVDTVYVQKDFTAKQFVDEFGIDKVHKNVKEAYEEENGAGKGRIFQHLHAIEPRPANERELGKKDGENMPWRSMHVDLSNRKMMREGGFNEFPSIITRFLLWNLFIKYGWGPGFESLPEVRGVNFFEKLKKVLAERQATPPVMHPENQEGDIDIRPAGRTTFDSKNPQAKAHAWMMDGRYDIAIEELRDSRQRIQRAFFVQLFQLLTNNSELRREKTAFEVAQMLAEQVKNFSPTFTLLKEDFLNPLLTRIFNICLRAGRFPPPPDSVLVETAEGFAIPTPKVNHVSKIAMLIKSIENENWIEFLQIAGLLQQMSPAAIRAFERKFNSERAMVTMANNRGVPSEFFNTIEEEQDVIARHEAEDQQAAAQAAAAVAKDASAALGSVPPEVVSQLPALE